MTDLSFKQEDKKTLTIIALATLLMLFLLAVSIKGCFGESATMNRLRLGWFIKLSDDPNVSVEDIVLLVPYPYFQEEPWLEVEDYLRNNITYQYRYWPEKDLEEKKATPEDVKLAKVNTPYGTFLRVEIHDLLTEERRRRENAAGANAVVVKTEWVVQPAIFKPSKKTANGERVRASGEDWPGLGPVFKSKEEAVRAIGQAVDYTPWQSPGNTSLLFVSYKGSLTDLDYSFSAHHEGPIGLLPFPGIAERISLKGGEQLESGNWYVVSISSECNL